MAKSSKKTKPALSKDLWITSGVFSNHYLLERLPQTGAKIWPSDEEVIPAIRLFKNYTKRISSVFGKETKPTPKEDLF